MRAATPLGEEDRGRLLGGPTTIRTGCSAPHPVRGGVAVRVLRPYATAVTVLAKGLRAELLRTRATGCSPGCCRCAQVPEYELLVAYDATATVTVQDPYRFLPALGELDLHLLGEGRHEQLWQALGARTMDHQGATGTRFTVWAPNAQGVRVVGNFNYWDGTGFPMRSLGSSGVWELFLPGIGEGELYKFEITRPDGSRTVRADPMARRTECPPATASVVHASHYAGRTRTGWRGAPTAPCTRRRSPSTRCTSPPGGPA